MGKVHIAGRAYIPPEPVLGTVFTVADAIWTGSTHADDSNIWQVPIGAPVGVAEQITDALNGVFDAGQEFYFEAIPSPDRSKFLCRYSNDGAVPGVGDAGDRWLAVMNPDGSDRVFVNMLRTDDPVWLGNDYILFADNFSVTTVTRVGADGTGKTVILTKSNIYGWDGAYDGSKVAYTALNPAMTAAQLGVCNPDGSGDTVLVASGILAAQPLWTLDSSRIVFRVGSGVDIINADGTGRTTIMASLPSAQWHGGGMATDRLWYTDRSSAMYRMARVMLDGSASGRISPERRLSQADPRGVAIWDEAQGRAFGILYGADPTPEEVFSVLPDGSDYRTHFVATEEDWSAPGENFQNLSWR